MHRWLYSHKLFGPFLTGWQDKRIFPTKFKYFMVITMCTSLTVMWATTSNPMAVLWGGLSMALVAIWSWRYPGSAEEHAKRVDQGKRVLSLR
jgi:hypothetical protein